MKRQDDAAPARRRARQAVQAAGAKSGKAGADERVPQGHDRLSVARRPFATLARRHQGGAKLFGEKSRR